MMKKVAAILILLLILLTGCVVTTEKEPSTEKTSRFVQVESDGSRWVVYDKYTKVMYVEKVHFFAPLYNADGSLMLWDSERSKE